MTQEKEKQHYEELQLVLSPRVTYDGKVETRAILNARYGLIGIGYAFGKSSAVGNAQRFVDCWNACAGMADPAAEIAALRARVAELEKEAGNE